MPKTTVSKCFCSLGTAVSTEHRATENHFMLQHEEGFMLGGNFNDENPKTLESVTKRTFLIASFLGKGYAANCWSMAAARPFFLFQLCQLQEEHNSSLSPP